MQTNNQVIYFIKQHFDIFFGGSTMGSFILSVVFIRHRVHLD